MQSRLELQRAADLRFDPCSNMKVLGSWCDDEGGSTGALVPAFRRATAHSTNTKRC